MKVIFPTKITAAAWHIFIVYVISAMIFPIDSIAFVQFSIFALTILIFDLMSISIFCVILKENKIRVGIFGRSVLLGDKVQVSHEKYSLVIRSGESIVRFYTKLYDAKTFITLLQILRIPLIDL